MQMTMAAAAFSCWTGTGCNCVSQPFLAQAQGKNSACFPETAVIMVARQRFQMFESVQFHLRSFGDHGVSQKNVFLSLRGHSASNLYL